MDIAEAQSYVNGVLRRSRSGWEQARLIAFCCLKPWSKDLQIDTFLPLPWENEQLSEQEQHAAVEQLYSRVEEFQNYLKNKRNGK